MTREIEIAYALAEHVSFADVALEVRWLLPVSKADPLALGTTLSWGCICSDSCRVCPYHALKNPIRILEKDFPGECGGITPGTP